MPIPITDRTTLSEVLTELSAIVAPAELAIFILPVREEEDAPLAGEDLWVRLLSERDRPATSWLVRVEPGRVGVNVSLVYLERAWRRLYVASVRGCTPNMAWHLARVISEALAIT